MTALARGAVLALALATSLSLGCGTRPKEEKLEPRSQTWAELRVVRRGVSVQAPDEKERAPYPRERLVDGEKVTLKEGGLAWLRRDGGATMLVRGPASLTMRAGSLDVDDGRVFVDTPPGVTATVQTPAGELHLADVRASLDASSSAKSIDAYVLTGEVRLAADGGAKELTAHPGERLIKSGTKSEVSPVLTWEDWTGGLATTDRAAAPSPYGVGTVGARSPGNQGAPRFPLAIQKLDVKVSIEDDLAVTEVDEVFFNPSSETVEGIYRFRTPDGATLARFGVDRDGVVVWGRVKEKEAAAAQYQSNVYAGSTEDPALLEWDAPGVYRARLYPIGPGGSRRVVVRYAEWLHRTGEKGERRLYVYPMAAEGLESSLPRIEELTAEIDLAKAGAREVRVGMQGARENEKLLVRAHDVVPRADLAVELFDDPKDARAGGGATMTGYRAKHELDLETLPPEQRDEAQKNEKGESDYLLVPLRAEDVPKGEGGLDLAVVVDTSAATDKAQIAIARAATAALLAHLGKEDRAVVWAGDATLRPVASGLDTLKPVDEPLRRSILEGLATIERGGATDLGAMIADAARALDAANVGATKDGKGGRRQAIVYIGDGAPTVGELSLADLRDKVGKLPHPPRVFGLGVGDNASMAILQGLARGAFAERIGDDNQAARAALRILESAEHASFLGASVDLGPTVERVFPRDLSALVEGESVLVVGRLAGNPPESITVTGPSGAVKHPLAMKPIDDHGDLRRRWAEARLGQMIDEATGRAAMVDLGSRHGIITPVTSFYVPTTNEMTAGEKQELAKEREELQEQLADRRDRLADHRARAHEDADNETAVATADGWAGNKEGGTGTRAKGEEGAMGSPARKSAGARFAVQGPVENRARTATATDEPMSLAQAAAPMPSIASTAAPGAPPAPPAIEAMREASKTKNAFDGPAGAQPAAPRPRGANGAPKPDTGFGLDGIGKGGGGRGEGIGLGSIGTIGHGTGAPTNDVKDASELGMIGLLPSGGDDGPVPPPHAHHAPPNSKNAKQGDLGGKVRTVYVRVVDDVPHARVVCSGAASVPLEDRVSLWRERMLHVNGNAGGVANVYRNALETCEAPSWRERSKLLSLGLDAMPSVKGKVALWRVMFKDLGAADALYRGILARVKTSAELRELHDALGLKSVDAATLAKLMKDAKTPDERVKKLRELQQAWPDDSVLALTLLDALEDAGDDAGARDLGRTLRARPDAGAKVRIAVGELWLRLAARATGDAAKKSAEAEARRAFGEIVEFAPDDPVARRTLGDLLRAHGWYGEAMRQYETLAKLAPDDASVALLLAAAANGQGRLEEAVKWTEKGGAAGSPDAEVGPAKTARAFAATYLAWGTLEATEHGNKDEPVVLRARLARVLGGAKKSPKTRATLVWSHPELHPTLWTDAGLGTMMPAPEGDVTIGIAQAPVHQASANLEVRVEPDEIAHAARLGATATLTVVFDEGTDKERVVKRVIAFKAGEPVQKLQIANGEVTP